MANTLLAAPGVNPHSQILGKNSVARFVTNQPQLKTRCNRNFHSQHEKCEDPETINAWFQRVHEMRQSYGILDEDIHNFGETCFMTGVIATATAATRTDTIDRETPVQPSDHEWITVIEGINGSGSAIPPFVILAGKVHQRGWYRDLPADWVVAGSDNGWTSDQLGLEWIKHFNAHTESHTKGTYRLLLLLDGNSSHATPEFDHYCCTNNIITLRMPAHTSHLLQPLDAGCFSPLKLLHGQEVQDLVSQGVHHIGKEDFLSIYSKIRQSVLTEQTIKGGFRATGFIPCDPQRVISSLVVTKTPSRPRVSHGEKPKWTSETAQSLVRLQQQVQLIRDLLQRQSQSPISQAASGLIKGFEIMVNSVLILAEENRRLRAENRRLRAENRRRKRKQHHLRQHTSKGNVLQAQNGRLLLQDADTSGDQDPQTVVRQRAPPTCSGCGIQGHRINQCKNMERY